jgi:glycosyltransferase involved in cell wall biosynthesis
MKILLVNDYGSIVGGVEVCVYKLMRNLEKKGHEVKLFSGIAAKKTIIRSYLISLYNIKKKMEISKTLEDFKPDVVQCHNIFGFLSPSILSEIKKRDIPLVMKLEDVRLFCPKNDLIFQAKTPCKYGYSSKCISTACFLKCSPFREKAHSTMNLGKIKIYRSLIKKHVDVFVSPSEFLARWAYNFFKKDIVLIRNSVELPEIKYKAINSPKKALFVGRLTRQKGLADLLSAFKMVSSELNNLQLDIVGEGPFRKEIEKDIGKNVYLHGFVRCPDEMNKYYQEASVLLLPSLSPENSPLTIVESMANGTPVITTNIGGQADLVRDNYNGFQAKPRNPKDLAQKLKIILENEKLREKMSKNCLSYAKNFSVKKQVGDVEKLFNSLVVKKLE